MRYLFIGLVLCFCLRSAAQNNPGSDSTDNCSSASDRYSKLFIKYLNRSQNDSVLYLFGSWQKLCGLSEPIQRAKIIFHLKTGSFNDSILGDSVSCNILKYLDRKHFNYSGNEQYFSYVPIGGAFDMYTDSISKILIRHYNIKSIEHLICELYGNIDDSILTKIKNPLYRNSRIARNPCNETSVMVHKKSRIREENKIGFEMALMTGIWIPDKGLSILGTHPEIGYQMGIRDDISSFQFSLIFRVGQAANEYYLKKDHSNDTSIVTKEFCGFYTGIDYGRTVFSFNRSEIQVLLGLGVDFFGPFAAEFDGKYPLSYNINCGMGYRFYFKNKTYLGIEPKYNIADYTLNGSTDLRGNYFSIRMVYGYIDNSGLGILPHKKKRRN